MCPVCKFAITAQLLPPSCCFLGSCRLVLQCKSQRKLESKESTLISLCACDASENRNLGNIPLYGE